MAENRRNSKGRFANGNPGGPGRPRRSVEIEYLARLSDTITLEDWGQIVDTARRRAIAGDPRARDWLARYLLGPSPLSLTRLAAMERSGISDIGGKLVEKEKADDWFYSALEQVFRENPNPDEE